MVLGRRTFDVGYGVWNDTPFAFTHTPLEPRVEKSGTFTFVTDVKAGYAQAVAAAGHNVVRLMGAEVSQHFLRAGLVAEIRVQIAPVMLGSGTRLFEHLEQLGAVQSPYVTHLRYRPKP